MDTSVTDTSTASSTPISSKISPRENSPSTTTPDLSSSSSSSSSPSTLPKSKDSNTNNQSSGNKILNDRFDQEFEVDNEDDESSIDTKSSTCSRSVSSQRGKSAHKKGRENVRGNYNPKLKVLSKTASSSPSFRPSHSPMNSTKSSFESSDTDDDDENNDDDEEEEEEEEDDDDDSGHSFPTLPGEYNPNDFLDLNVSPEIQQLFAYIQRYQPHDIELDTPLKCFIPSYLPSVGEIDAFVKIPRPRFTPVSEKHEKDSDSQNKNQNEGPPKKQQPEEERDELGLKVLDEPALHQSDAAVIELQLRVLHKKKYGSQENALVRSIEAASQNPHEIDRWISNMEQLHQSKPQAEVHYSQNFPIMEELMAPWPEEWEDKIRNGDLKLPDPDLDLSLEEYAKVLCVLLDIPVYEGSLIESVHMMMSLFLHLKQHQVSTSNLSTGVFRSFCCKILHLLIDAVFVDIGLTLKGEEINGARNKNGDNLGQ